MQASFGSPLRGLTVAALVACGAAGPASASLLTLETRQHTLASICIGGSLGCSGGASSRVSDEAVDALSHSNHFDGDPTTPSQARAASRSGPGEIAANASFVHRDEGSFQAYSEVRADAIYEWDVLVLNEGEVSFTFQLPPTFVEIQSNAEFRSLLDLTASVQADIQFCTPSCSYSATNESLFQAWADLEGDWEAATVGNNATSADPDLDVSALVHDEVVLTNQGFLHTWTWESEAFTGTIDLGHFTAGDTFTLSYRMLAEVGAEFPGFETSAAAALNDPFFLSSDPLPQQDLVTFHLVPEPGPAALLASGLVVAAGAPGTLRRTAPAGGPRVPA